MNFTPVILCGGNGKRLWPVSRQDKPKQFLKFGSNFSLLQRTLQRCAGPDFASRPIVVCNEKHSHFAKQDARELGVNADIILEPESRNSGPALAAAAFYVLKTAKPPLLLALATDHAISDQFGFLEALKTAMPTTQSGYLVTFGIHPTSPNPNFGYIKPGEKLKDTASRKVSEFVEKPDLLRVPSLIQEGYVWNSGNFLFKADVFLNELKAHAPDIYRAAEASVTDAIEDAGYTRLGRHHFLQAPALPVDIAVLEKSNRVAVCQVDHDWSDIGTWDGLWEANEKDEDGNVGFGDIELLDSQNSFVQSDDRLTTLVGVKNVVVISTKDTVLVINRDESSKIKPLLDHLDMKGRSEATQHGWSDRPWGRFEVLDEGDRFKVKRIFVSPGGILSLQKHEHRSEHWTVVQGVATITIGDDVKRLKENEHEFIPLGAIHRIENQENEPLIIIEVQTGSLLSEDDIIRLEDNYGRSLSKPRS